VLKLDAAAHALGGLLLTGRAAGAAAVEVQLAGVPVTPLAEPNPDGDWSLWLSNAQLASQLAWRNASITVTALSRHGDRSSALEASLLVDILAPSVTNVIQEGERLRVVLDESVVLSAALQNSSFSVRAGTRSIAVQAIVGQANASGHTELLLQLSERLSTEEVVKLSYNGVGIADGLGNPLAAFKNHVVSHVAFHESIGAVTTTPAYSYETLELSGSAPVQIFGNEYNNRLIGNQGDNLLVGGRGADIITGGPGRDTYQLVNLADSLLLDPLTRAPAIDHFTDFSIGTDIIDGPFAIAASAMVHLNVSAAIPSAGLLTALLHADVLPARGGAVLSFEADSSIRTFVVLNDDNPGYAPGQDSLFEITGYSGVLRDLRVI
jgi:hypothetical protein